MARSSVWPLLVYLPITAAMLAPHVLPWSEYSTQTFDFLDAHISMWSLWWTRHALASLQNPFWTDHVFFPQGTSLAFHSYPFLYGVLSIPIQHAAAGKQGLAVAFNTLIAASFLLSAIGAYLLALHVTRNRHGALIAGLIYAFMPYHILNSCRLAVLATEIMPFYVLALLRLHERRAWTDAALLSLCLALAYYNSVEYALYLSLLSGLWLAHRAIARDPGVDRVLLSRLGGAALLFALLAAPLLAQQVRVVIEESHAVGHKLADASRWSAALASFVTPNRVHPLYGGIWAFAGEFRDGVTLGMRSETAVGWTALLLFALAFAGGKRERPAFWGLTALLFFGLCLGPHLRLTGTWSTSIPMPYALLYEVFPPLRAVKEPTRMFPVAMLLLSVTAAFGVRGLIERLSPEPRRATALTLLLGFAILFESLTAWPWDRTPHESVAVSPVYARLAADPAVGSIMDLTGPDATLAAQPVHAKRTVEWLGFIPRAAATRRKSPLFELGRALTDARAASTRDPAAPGRLAQYRDALRAARTRYILLPPFVGERRAFVEAAARALGGSLRAEPGMLLIDLQPTASH